MERGGAPVLPSLFQDMRRSLAPGGAVVVADVRPSFAYTPTAGGAGGPRGHWLQQLADAGFEQVGTVDAIDGDFAVRVYRVVE